MALRGPAQCPLLMAAIVALCGVALIVVSSVWPSGQAASEAKSKAFRSEHLYDFHLRALAELRQAGTIGNVDVVDYGDGLGLAVGQSVAKGSIILEVPEALSLDALSTRSCPGDSSETASDVQPSAACLVELAVAQAVSRGEASNFTALISLLTMERRRGSIDGLEPTSVTAALQVLPDVSWPAESGLFAIDEEEFRVLGVGTSMENWQQTAINEAAKAHDFVQRTVAAKLGSDISIGLDEVRWACLMLLSHAQWTQDDSSDDGSFGFPAKAVFILPLLLSRPTPEWQHGVQLRYDQERKVYEVLAARAMRPGEEIHFVDRRLSDASALCFRGLQLVGQHRARLTLNVSSANRDAAAQATLDRFGCGAQPLNLYVHAQKVVDPHFLGCMRMLALAGNATLLRRAERAGWLKNWPQTGMVDRRTEAAATELAVNSLSQVLGRLGGSSTEIRQRFGGDAVATRPTVKVREAETMIVVGLLKSMKELQLVSSNEYLFEALRESQGKRKKQKESIGSSGGGSNYGRSSREYAEASL